MDSLAELIAKFDREHPEDMRIAREELKRRPLTSNDFSCVDITEVLLCHEIARLRAELEECKRDAERYRWLRDPACTHPHIANDCAGDDMDRAFDRVMGKAALAAKEE